jgi:hypothetical protein
MTSLPKYYFQDISSELMGEIMDEVAETRPESTLEELDQWLNSTESWFKHPKSFIF